MYFVMINIVVLIRWMNIGMVIGCQLFVMVNLKFSRVIVRKVISVIFSVGIFGGSLWVVRLCKVMYLILVRVSNEQVLNFDRFGCMIISIL